MTKKGTALAPQIARIIARIPGMPIRETVALWRNAIKTLVDQTRAARHPDAREVISAIYAEWVRRRGAPIDPDEFFDWPDTDVVDGSGGLHTDDWEKVECSNSWDTKSATAANRDGSESEYSSRFLTGRSRQFFHLRTSMDG